MNVSTPRNILLTGGPGGGIRRQGCALSCATDTVLRPLPPSHSQLHTMGSQGTFPLLASATPYRRKTALPHGMLLALFDALGRWDPNSKPPDHYEHTDLQTTIVAGLLIRSCQKAAKGSLARRRGSPCLCPQPVVLDATSKGRRPDVLMQSIV